MEKIRGNNPEEVGGREKMDKMMGMQYGQLGASSTVHVSHHRNGVGNSSWVVQDLCSYPC